MSCRLWHQKFGLQNVVQISKPISIRRNAQIKNIKISTLAQFQIPKNIIFEGFVGFVGEKA